MQRSCGFFLPFVPSCGLLLMGCDEGIDDRSCLRGRLELESEFYIKGRSTGSVRVTATCFEALETDIDAEPTAWIKDADAGLSIP
jgi:hypothetical protein